MGLGSGEKRFGRGLCADDDAKIYARPLGFRSNPMRDQPYDGFAAITARWSEGLVGWGMSEKASQSGDLGENSTPERVSADLFDQGLACLSRVFR